MTALCGSYLLVAGVSVSLWAQSTEAPAKVKFDTTALTQSVSLLAKQIRESYYDPTKVTTDTLIQGAFSGMLSALDPHSSYLSPKEYLEVQLRLSGSFAGVGLSLEIDETTRATKVQSVMKGTPAARLGIQSGDYLIAVKEKGATRRISLNGLPLEKTVSLVRGVPGTVVEVTVYRPSEKKRITVSLTREQIEIPSVEGFLLPASVGLLNLASFGEDTCEKTEREIEKMVKANSGRLRGMIVNLRDNPGGSLDTAICVSDLFLDGNAPQKTIVSMRGTTPENSGSRNVETMKPGDILNGAPLVVVVNGSSASASEIFAGAMQDNRRGSVVGSTTFGKGTVQALFLMDDGGVAKITVARYYTPLGRSIQATGIVPDVTLRDYTLKEAEGSDPQQTTEADLFGHLGESADTTPASPQAVEQTQALDRLAKDDPILFQAYTLLKGIIIFHR